MKIVHIISSLAVGGAEYALLNLLKSGLANRFENRVVSLTGEGTIASALREVDVKVSVLGMQSPWSSASALRRLVGMLREYRPDLIQGWMYHGNLAATLALALMPDKPILCWNVRHCLEGYSNEKLVTQLVIRANCFASRLPAALIYNSFAARGQHESFGFSSHKGRVLPNGIDLEQFQFSNSSRSRMRAELHIPPDALVVGHVARLHRIKGHEAFLRVAVKLALHHPQLHVLLAGRRVSLAEPSIQRLIPVNLQNRFHLLGECSDVAELMSSMDVFCQSSLSESFPNVLCEAMAIGLPCVATDVGDSALIVGDTGRIVAPGDEKSMMEELEKLLIPTSQPSGHRRGKARDRITANYSLSAIVNRYDDLYDELGNG